MKKEKLKKILLSGTIYIILFCTLIYSGIKIYNWQKENKHSSDIKSKIDNVALIENNGEYSVNFESLSEQNTETVAWLKVNNTNIQYPIVKAQNNEFYLNHSFDKSDNTAGWIFADYKNKFDGTDKNIVIYGHNRKDKSMFGTLTDILNPEWYNNTENMDILFDMPNQNCICKVFSIYRIEKESYYIQTNFSSDAEFDQFLETLKKRSIKNFGTEVSKDDSILTLSTCDANDNYRVVLHAKKS